MRTFALMLTISASLAAGHAAAQGDGQMAFNNHCRTCHTTKEGDNRQGPHLAGIIGRKAGSLPDFNYSPSMKDSGLTWDASTLDRFMADPDGVVHGNTMKPFGGVSDAEQRKAIIEFLETGR